MRWTGPPSAPRVRTPTSGVLVEALFLLATLTGAAMSAIAIAAGRPRPSAPAQAPAHGDGRERSKPERSRDA